MVSSTLIWRVILFLPLFLSINGFYLNPNCKMTKLSSSCTRHFLMSWVIRLFGQKSRSCSSRKKNFPFFKQTEEKNFFPKLISSWKFFFLLSFFFFSQFKSKINLIIIIHNGYSKEGKTKKSKRKWYKRW